MARQPRVKVGDRFGKLTVVEKIYDPIKVIKKDKNGNVIGEEEIVGKKFKWLCKCDCGNEIKLSQSALLTERSTIRSCNECQQEKNPNYVNGKMTYEEQQDLDELYQYVKVNVFGYDKKQALPQNVVGRLQGLRYGKYFNNKKSKNNADYSDKVILNTFKFCLPEIQRGLKNNNFKDDQHRINYVAKIIENNINDVYTRMKNAEKTQKEIESVDASQVTEYVNTFKKKEDKKTSNRLSELW